MREASIVVLRRSASAVRFAFRMGGRVESASMRSSSSFGCSWVARVHVSWTNGVPETNLVDVLNHLRDLLAVRFSKAAFTFYVLSLRTNAFWQIVHILEAVCKIGRAHV